MRNIVPEIPQEYRATIGDPSKVSLSNPIHINSFRKLVETTAKFAYHNKDYLLFFRGQTRDYLNKADSSSFYPTIYRDAYLQHRELVNRFDILEGSSKALIDLFRDKGIDGHQELKRRKLIQWSILQHYEVCDTPLLDFTHSLRVACSFAQLNNSSKIGYVFAFGFPYITNRISFNTEHDLVNVRLLSICPPQALRPHFQEGYLAGTDEITHNYDRKNELDFNNRLIAKFEIPTNGRFWGNGFHQIPEQSLYPNSDPIKTLCDEIKNFASRELKSGDLGDFLKYWGEIEEIVTRDLGKNDKRFLSFRKALSILVDSRIIDKDLYYQIDGMRDFRNMVVHHTSQVSPNSIKKHLVIIEQVLGDLKKRMELA